MTLTKDMEVGTYRDIPIKYNPGDRQFRAVVKMPGSHPDAAGKLIKDRSQAGLEKKILRELGEGATVKAMTLQDNGATEISLIRRTSDSFVGTYKDDKGFTRTREVGRWSQIYHFDQKVFDAIEAFAKKRKKIEEALDAEFDTLCKKAKCVALEDVPT